jgi:hypothetical protein
MRAVRLTAMKNRRLTLCAGVALLLGCAQTAGLSSDPRPLSAGASIIELVQAVRAEPAKKPLLARSMMSGTLLIIPDPHAPTLTALSFQQNERSFIPVFSDQKTFDEEAFGTGFAGKAVAVSGDRFAGLLKGDETVILNPGHRPAIEFHASELRSATRR